MITYDGYNLQYSQTKSEYNQTHNLSTVAVHKTGFSLIIEIGKNKINSHNDGIILLQKMEQMHKDGMSWENIKTYYEL